MAIARGTRFGSYEVAALVGVGGMGEVYRARDTELKRDVALKVLPAELANDAERLARLKREAEMLAALNHTNIAQIHGLERGDGQTALVMEFVEGQTLAERITLGPILPEEALGIAMQIADGLEAAHARGIVHRDLKPANVKLTADGIVKLLDFGIAKALDTRATSGSQAPQLTTPAMTEAGVVLGTAAYMSPEQARGKPVDERADIWAFGCVLYEMLTGQPAFGGEDVTDTLARVLERHADFGLLPKTVPPAVRRTLELCLEKDLRRRIADIRDVKLALDGRFEEQGARAAGSRTAPTAWRRALPLVAALAAGAGAVGLAAWSVWPKPEPKPVKRFVYALPEGQEFTGPFHVMDLAPDGSALVYSGVGGLRLRDMATLEERAIGGADGLLSAPTFSPDGQSIAFLPPTGIHRLPVAGGPAARVSERVLRGAPALHWAPDGTIFFSDIGGIYRVPASGGTPELIVDAEGGVVFGPRLLPDGDTLLFTRNTVSATTAQAQVIAQSLATSEQTVVVDRGVDARYVPTGHIVYLLEDTLFGVAFDLQTKRVTGGAVPLVQGVSGALWAQFAIANDGTLAYVRGLGADQNPRVLVWVDRDGRETALRAPARNYTYVELSPDERRLALDIRDQESDVWVFDLARESLQRLTFDPGQNRGVVWSADSARIAFSRELGATEEIYWQAADGSGTPLPLTQDSGMAITPWDITADGTLLFATSALPRDIFMIPVAGPAGPGTPLLDGPASEGSPTVSPDGRWLAYSSDENGRYQIYVRPFPDVDSGRWQISTAGGIHPHWSSDGGELFYLEVRGAEVAMMAVAVESGETFRPDVPVALFQGGYFSAGEIAGPDTYDVSADGQRFLMIAESRAAGADNVRPDIVIVQNWFEELKRLVPTE